MDAHEDAEELRSIARRLEGDIYRSYPDVLRFIADRLDARGYGPPMPPVQRVSRGDDGV